jgi:hypothetical protein
MATQISNQTKPPKNESIMLRVDSKMKNEIIKLATESRRELSDYLRQVLINTIEEKVKI